MANYEAYERTNYVKVRSMENLLAAMKEIDGLTLIEKDGKIGFIITDELFVPEVDECKSIDKNLVDEWGAISFIDFFAPHIADKEVCVIQHVGREKMRYLAGQAIAFDNTKKQVSINIDEIYQLAEKEFGVYPGHAQY